MVDNWKEQIEGLICGLINDFTPSQNPVWGKPSDEDVIDRLTQILGLIPIEDEVEPYSTSDMVLINECSEDALRDIENIESLIEDIKYALRDIKRKSDV